MTRGFYYESISGLYRQDNVVPQRKILKGNIERPRFSNDE